MIFPHKVSHETALQNGKITKEIGTAYCVHMITKELSSEWHHPLLSDKLWMTRHVCDTRGKPWSTTHNPRKFHDSHPRLKRNRDDIDHSVLKSKIFVLQLFPWCFYQTRTKKSNVSEPIVLFRAKWFFSENSEPKSNIQLHKICLSVAQLATVVHYSAFQNRAMRRFENHRETP